MSGRGDALRLFVALDPPDGHRAALAARLEGLDRELPPARWVPERNLHVTVRFLGPVSEASVDAGSSDPDDAFFALTQSPAGPYPVGYTLVTLTADDGRDVASCTARLFPRRGRRSLSAGVTPGSSAPRCWRWRALRDSRPGAAGRRRDADQAAWAVV